MGVAFYASLCGAILFLGIVTPSIMYSIPNPVIGVVSGIGATVGIAVLIGKSSYPHVLPKDITSLL